MTSRAFSQPELMNENGVASFQDLNIADTGVRDMGVHTRCTVPPWTST